MLHSKSICITAISALVYVVIHLKGQHGTDPSRQQLFDHRLPAFPETALAAATSVFYKLAYPDKNMEEAFNNGAVLFLACYSMRHVRSEARVVGIKE